MSTLKIIMAGHVVVPIPESKKGGDTLQTNALVLGIHHRPILAVPLKYVSLDGAEDNGVQWPRSECLYVDSNGLDYVMIDITNCHLSTVPEGEPSSVTLGDLDHAVDLTQFVTNNYRAPREFPTGRKVRNAPGIAATFALRGTLSEDATTVSKEEFVGWEEKDRRGRTKYLFRKRVLRFMVMESPKAAEHHIFIRTGVTTFGLTLISDCEIVCRLTSLCGWTGASTKFLDLDNGRTMFPDTDPRWFPNDIESRTAPIHPGTDPCNPSRVTTRG